MVPLTGETDETIEVLLTNGESTRVYYFKVQTEPIVTNISVNNSAIYGGGTTYTWDKKFDLDSTDYTVGTKSVGDKGAYIWVNQYGVDDTIEVVSYEGLSAEPTIAYSTSAYRNYITCTFAETGKGTTADLVFKVRSGSGTRSKLYHLRLYTGNALPLPEISGAVLENRSETAAVIGYTASKKEKVYYLLTDPDAEALDAAAIAAGGKERERRSRRELSGDRRSGKNRP